jgi:hypothetical protein
MCWKFLKAPWPKHCKTYCHESQLRSIGKFSGQAASLLPPASLKWLRWQHLSTGTTLSLTVYYIECFPVPTVRKCPFLLLCHHRGVTNFVLQLAILCRHVWTFFFPNSSLQLCGFWLAHFWGCTCHFIVFALPTKRMVPSNKWLNVLAFRDHSTTLHSKRSSPK